ncbi:hypothetical protein ENINCK372B1_22440 [Enterobacter intestinihominis]
MAPKARRSLLLVHKFCLPTPCPGSKSRLPALKPAGLYLMSCSVHNPFVFASLVDHIPD